MVGEIDDKLAAVEPERFGGGFVETPLRRDAELDAAAAGGGGAVFVKDETGNVSGCFKSRHIMGIAIHLAARDAWATRNGGTEQPARLAIASCGNAALAAATVAAAVERHIDVFVPENAEAPVLAKLAALGAHGRGSCCHYGGQSAVIHRDFYTNQRMARHNKAPRASRRGDQHLQAQGG